MRIDLFLKQSTLLKRRTLAKGYCELGFVLVNGKKVKPSSNVNDGDIIEISLGKRIVIARAVIKVTPKREFGSYQLIEVKELSEH